MYESVYSEDIRQSRLLSIAATVYNQYSCIHTQLLFPDKQIARLGLGPGHTIRSLSDPDLFLLENITR